VKKFVNDGYDFVNHASRSQASNDLILANLAMLLSPESDVSCALGRLAGALDNNNKQILDLHVMVDSLKEEVKTLSTRLAEARPGMQCSPLVKRLSAERSR